MKAVHVQTLDVSGREGRIKNIDVVHCAREILIVISIVFSEA